jgi:Transposase and inactivated derivatives, IS30 family
MKKWKHLNNEQRKLIASFLTKGMKLCEIADYLQFDPTTISKEIKRNRIITKKGKTDKVCKHTIRFPYCCNGCKKRYQLCPFKQYKYDSSNAHDMYQAKLINSRSGLNMTPEEYLKLDTTIKNGVDNNQSIYHIIKSNPDLNISVPSVYRLINQRKLTVKRMDLPYAVTYKKRKSLKQYEYRENSKIDRSQRTYLEFLLYKRNHPHLFHIQMDFLGKIISDKKSILTVTIPDIHFVILFLVEAPNSQKVVNLFNHLELLLTTSAFSVVFPFILTDRDPSFSNIDDIESSCITSEPRTSIFFCDSFNSSQKANVEQMNKQLRKFFPKGKSIDHLLQDDLNKVALLINNTHIASLSGATPNEAFIKVFGDELYNKLMSF